MIPIEVTARFTLQGETIPGQFRWQGLDYPIISTGRHWFDSGGYHVLVMTPDEQVYELVFISAEMRWYLGSFGGYHKAV